MLVSEIAVSPGLLVPHAGLIAEAKILSNTSLYLLLNSVFGATVLPLRDCGDYAVSGL